MSITNFIKSGYFKNIIVLTGAGVSTNSGIPDFRSKDGLLSKYSDELITKTSPLYIDVINKINKASPSSSHKFCNWLNDNNWLRRVYTQNIDGLHQEAGLSEDMVVEYHGSAAKDNVVFMGDNIQEEVKNKVILDFVDNPIPIDLLIVLGSSLQVAPFCALPNLVPKSCTRVLVDLCPENAFTNYWSKIKCTPIDMYNNKISPKSDIKICNRKVSLRPQWGNHSKWKSQHIVTNDCDVWVDSIMSD